MLLCEADGKTLLARYGIPVPTGALVEDGRPLPQDGVIKAQTLSGGRGLGGLVSVAHADPDEAADAIRSRLAALDLPLLLRVEDRLAIARELYLRCGRTRGTAGSS